MPNVNPTQKEVIDANASLFLQGYLETGWDMLSDNDGMGSDDAIRHIIAAAQAGRDAAEKEWSEYPDTAPNPEAMIQKGQDYVPHLG